MLRLTVLSTLLLSCAAFAPRVPTMSAASSIVNGVTVPGKLKPDGNFILVKLRKADEVSEGGVFLPGQAQEKPRDGTVVALGPGSVDFETGVRKPIELSEGDKVLFGEYDGVRVIIDGEDFQMIEERNVLLVFKGEENEKPNIEDCRLLEDFIAVRCNKPIDETTRGVLIAASAQEMFVPQDGEVIAVGPGKRTSRNERLPLDIEVGENVRFRDLAGNDLTLRVDNAFETIRIVRFDEVLAKWQ